MLKVAIAGFGAIGFAAARALDQGIAGLSLSAVSARNTLNAETKQRDFARPVPVLPLVELAVHADIVVEALPPVHFDELADSVIDAGRIFMPLSCGQLLRRGDLVGKALSTGARIIVPTGALLGLDAVRAAAEGDIKSVKIVTTKPPNGLAGAPYLIKNHIDIQTIRAPQCVFTGNALEGALGFPANVNVAAALAMAGVGPERTRLEIWADPAIGRNQHRILVESDSADIDMTIRNIPSEDNPRTGKITCLSLIACLRRLTATLVAGS